MSKKCTAGSRKRSARILEARFAEVEFDPPSRRGMIVELEGGVRLLVSDEKSVELAAALINGLWEQQLGGGR